MVDEIGTHLHSTTFGTRKKWSSVAGAFLTISSGMPPSVTTSARFFISIGVTEVIGSTPVDVDLGQLLDEGQDGVELALKVLDLLLGDRDAREMRDAADGSGVDGHCILVGPRGQRGVGPPPSRAIAEWHFLPQRRCRPLPYAAAGREPLSQRCTSTVTCDSPAMPRDGTCRPRGACG